MLIGVIFLLALFTIAMAVAVPKITKQIQRDRELETMHRGKQYSRAVKMYYKKFGTYPTSIDLLVKPVNNVRFLRKKYADPTTGKTDWKPVYQGKNKAPLTMGFFGQPIGGAGCGSNLTGTSTTGSDTSSVSPTNTSSSSSISSSAGSLNTNCPTGSLTPSSNSPTATNNTNPTDPNSANTGTAGNTSGNGSTTGLSGQIIGGPIIGFSPNSLKQSIMVYKTKNHYNEWEFVYDPLGEQMMQASAPGGPTGLPGSSGVPGSTLGIGSGGQTGGSNSGGTTTPTPSAPTQ